MKNFLILLAAFLIFFGCENQEKKDDFSIGLNYYSIVPGTPEWKDLKTHDEMLEATQLPEEQIKSLSTADLAEACLAYPLLIDMRLFNDIKSGRDSVISNFNGLQELLNRKDAGKVLVSIYKNMDPEKISTSWEDLKIGKFASELSNIEIIISHDRILSKLNKIEKIELVKTAYDFAGTKIKKSDIFGLYSQKPGAFLISRALINAKFNPFVKKVNSNKLFKSFVNAGKIVKNDETIDFINKTLSAANEFLKVNK